MQEIQEGSARDRGQSVCGGIHFRFGQEAGAELGRRLGAYVYNRFGPAPGCPCCDEEEQMREGDHQVFSQDGYR